MSDLMRKPTDPAVGASYPIPAEIVGVGAGEPLEVASMDDGDSGSTCTQLSAPWPNITPPLYVGSGMKQ